MEQFYIKRTTKTGDKVRTTYEPAFRDWETNPADGIWIIKKEKSGRSFKWLNEKISDIPNIELRGHLEQYRENICRYLNKSLDSKFVIDKLVTGIFDILQTNKSFDYEVKNDQELKEVISKAENELKLREIESEKKKNLKRKINNLTIKNFVVLYYKDTYYNSLRFCFFLNYKKKNILKNLYYDFDEVDYLKLIEFIPQGFEEVAENVFEYCGKKYHNEEDAIKVLEGYGFERIIQLEDYQINGLQIWDNLLKIVTGKEK